MRNVIVLMVLIVMLGMGFVACGGGSSEEEAIFQDGYSRIEENPFYDPNLTQLPNPNDVRVGEPVPLDKYDLENLRRDYYYIDDYGVARWRSWEEANQ